MYNTSKEVKETSELEIMAKHFIRVIKTYFQLRKKIIEHYTYGYFLAGNGHLTSFAYGTEEEASTFMSARGTF